MKTIETQLAAMEARNRGIEHEPKDTPKLIKALRRALEILDVWDAHCSHLSCLSTDIERRYIAAILSGDRPPDCQPDLDTPRTEPPPQILEVDLEGKVHEVSDTPRTDDPYLIEAKKQLESVGWLPPLERGKLERELAQAQAGLAEERKLNIHDKIEKASMKFERDDMWPRLARCEAERDRLRAALHAIEAHPDFEYKTTSGMRKAWDNDEIGDGWERNIDKGRDGWERFDYHEEAYWRRALAETRP